MDPFIEVEEAAAHSVKHCCVFAYIERWYSA
jgi:hypothetical protein